MGICCRAVALSVFAISCQTGVSSTHAPLPPKAASAPEAATNPKSPDAPASAVVAEDPTPAFPSESDLGKAIESIVSTHYNRAAEMIDDSRKVVFVSNRSGLPQLFKGEVRKPKKDPVVLTATDQRIVAHRVTPDGKGVLFLSDTGADEQFSIFHVSTSGGSITELTPGERLHRDMPHFVATSTRTFYYSARRRDESKTRLYTHQIHAKTPPKLQMAHQGTASLIDMTADGTLGILREFVSLSEQRILLWNVATSSIVQAYPPIGEREAVGTAAFSAEDKRIFVTTDLGGQGAALVAVDVATRKEVTRYIETEPKTALLSSIEVSPSGKHIAVLVNAGNHHMIRFLSGRSLVPYRMRFETPLGSGQLGKFDARGRRLTFEWSTADAPLDIWSFDMAKLRAAPLRKDPRKTLSSLPKIQTTIAEIPSFDSLRIPVNIYVPKKVLQEKRRVPVVVSVHGGPAASSTVRFSEMVRFFSSMGFAVVEPNVRGSTGFGRAYEMADNVAKRLDAVHDLEQVARWTQTQPWADGKRLIVVGGSYGGYMVLMALTRQPELWAMGIDFVGVSNWRSFMKSTTGAIREILSKEFGAVESHGALLDALSPLKDVGRIVAPLLVYQGANDPRVPRAESDQIVSALRKRGVPVEYMVAEDEGHSIDRRATKMELFSRIARFTSAQLPPTAAPPAPE